MAKNEENPKLQLKRSPWKSPSRHRNSEKPLHLNLELTSPKTGDKQQSKEECGESSSVALSPPKKRKRNDIHDESLDEMLEEEIEKQWDKKAEKSKLTVLNVKNILKSVITNKYVVDMVRQTIEKGNFTDMPFEPKFTRAKKKELLQQLPDAPLPPVVGLLTPMKPLANDINPEMKLLMTEDLHEDSSDEEYNPDNEPVEQSDDDESRGETSFLSDADSLPPTPASLHAPPTPSQDLSQDGSFKVPLENVGQRTRSKLDLNRLAVESLEQMFVPPDVPEDMYEEECDNPDWQEFLQEFAQPMCHNETIDDDVENDPEYNILADEVKLKVDREEMRKDKAVKVTRKELNDLMDELFDFTDITAGENDMDQTTESLAELEASIMQETEDRQRREELEVENLRKQEEVRKQEDAKAMKKMERRGMVPSQKLLLAQQIRQHVQLTVQHFLQTFKHPTFHYYSGICRTMLTTLTGLTTDKVFCQPIDNLEAAMKTVNKWEDLHSHPETGDKIRTFVKEQIALEKVRRRSKRNTHMNFPKELMQTAADSEALLYPSLLPFAPFRTTFNMAGPNSFTHSEDMLIAISLEQVTQLMEERKRKYKRRRLIDKATLIYNASIPRCSPHHIARRISTQTCSKTSNPIKSLMETGQVPNIVHIVKHVQRGVKLSQRPLEQFPQTWRTFLNTENQNPSFVEAAEKSNSTSLTSPISDKVKTQSKTKQLSKNKEPSQDLPRNSSLKSYSSPIKSSTGPMKSSEKKSNSEESNTEAILPCATVSHKKPNFKKSCGNLYSNTEFTTKTQHNKSNLSSKMKNTKCNGELSRPISNNKKGSKGDCNNKCELTVEPASQIISCNTLVIKSVSQCKVQSTKIVTEVKNTNPGQNLPRKENVLGFDVKKTIRSIINSNLNKEVNVAKSPETPIVAERLSYKSPKKIRSAKKKVSFRLENMKIESSKSVSREENIEKQPHFPPKVKFSLKFQNNNLGCRLNKSRSTLVRNQTIVASNSTKESLFKNSCELDVKNHKYKTTKQNIDANSLKSPTKTISHSPKPPSTVKLKKV